jgi:hypothetical protein
MRKLGRSCTLLLAAFPLCGCETEKDLTAPEHPVLFVAEDNSDVITVPPSTDCALNAWAIQQALNDAEPGDVVYLTDGDATTVDTYCVSEGIVVLDGFDGTLKGEGVDNTIIDAVRRPGDEPFYSNFDSKYFPAPGAIWPTVLHFEYPVDVTVRDLTMTESDPGHPGNYFQFVSAWGGDHTAVFENLALLGDPPSPEWLVSVHIMGGPVGGSLDGEGHILVHNVETNDVVYGPTLMWYGDDSTITVDDVRATRAFFGIWAEGLTSGLQITGSTFTASPRNAIRLQTVSDAIISGNTIEDQHFGAWWHSGIYLRHRVQNSIITRNTFEDLSGEIGQGIFLRGLAAPGWEVSGITIDHNTFTHSELPGWNADTPNGPGAVHLSPYAFDNEVFEMKYPPGMGKALCQMIWDQTDDESTTEYDGANVIHGWQPCESLAERDARMDDTELDLGFPRGYD